MKAEYISLRYIYVAEVTDNKRSDGYFIYCYKLNRCIDTSAYTNYIDSHILQSIQVYYNEARLEIEDMEDDRHWQNWMIRLQKLCFPFYFLPSCKDLKFNFQITNDEETVIYPSFCIAYYPQVRAIMDDPSYPFNKIDFRYNIKLTKRFNAFATELYKFVENSVYTFNELCPMFRFNNQYNHEEFDGFYKLYAYKMTYSCTELMHEVIDVYNEEHLKPFMTKPNSFCTKDDIRDSPYTAYCFRPTGYGTYENDVIENSALCEQLSLTTEEKYALIAHEIGHFVEAKNNGNIYRGNEEEFKCDEYAVDLGLSDHLKAALRKILDAKICDTEKNRMIQERLMRLGCDIL